MMIRDNGLLLGHPVYIWHSDGRDHLCV